MSINIISISIKNSNRSNKKSRNRKNYHR